MSISFEEAVAQLKVMFPDWDQDTLSTLLTANNYHVERTIETVLSMSGDTSVGESTNTGSVAPIPAPAPAPAYNPDLINNTVHERKPSHITPAPNSTYSPSSSYRGIKVELPNDFLRPPGWESTAMNDEQLALMLQNKLFQEQVREAFGDEFIRNYQNHSTNNNNRNSTGRQDSRGPSRTNSISQQQDTSSADLGIVKALSSMGTATKKSLTALAERFSSKNNASQQQRSSLGGRQFRPLVETNSNDEGDDTEVISFDSGANRSSHVLQETSKKKYEPDEGDSENPLLQNQYATNNTTINNTNPMNFSKQKTTNI